MSSNLLKPVLILLLLTIINCEENDTCIFDGCTCRSDAKGQLSIDCISSDQNSTEFPKRNAQSPTQNISFLLFYGFKTQNLPANIFANLSIKYLHLISTNLDQILSTSFLGIKYLEELVMFRTNIGEIEPDSFEPFKDTLRKFEMVGCNLTVSKYESIILNNTRLLEPLKILNLADNSLNELKLDWFSPFQQLKEIYLSKNGIEQVELNLFKSNKLLRVIDLSENRLNRIPKFFTSLTKFSFRFSLQLLKLNHNLIQIVENFSDLEELLDLDLANNEIEEITFNNFNKLINLERLNLENNAISFIEEDSLLANTRLRALYLNNNHLSRIPNLSSLNDLNTLNIENQNGHLDSLDDFAFDTMGKMNRYQNMVVYLRKNEIVRFSNRTFCSRNLNKNSNIDMVYIEYSSIRNMDKCLLRQLKSNNADYPTNVIIDDTQIDYATNITQYTDVCNCELIQFANHNSIRFIGVCKFFNLVCDEAKFTDDCDEKAEFSC